MQIFLILLAIGLLKLVWEVISDEKKNKIREEERIAKIKKELEYPNQRKNKIPNFCGRFFLKVIGIDI
jgi:hypothetical protein